MLDFCSENIIPYKKRYGIFKVYQYCSLVHIFRCVTMLQIVQKSVKFSLNKNWSFPLRTSSVNMTKSAGNLLKKPLMENFIFCAVFSYCCWQKFIITIILRSYWVSFLVGFNTLFGLDCNSNGEGIMLLFCEDIMAKIIGSEKPPVEISYLELTLRKQMWLIGFSYNPNKYMIY